MNKADLLFATNAGNFVSLLVVDLYNFYTKSLEQMQTVQALTMEFHTVIIFVMIN
jgi:hypothetical protein